MVLNVATRAGLSQDAGVKRLRGVGSSEARELRSEHILGRSITAHSSSQQGQAPKECKAAFNKGSKISKHSWPGP